MRNWIFILFWGLVASACAVQTPSGTQPPLQDPTADIDLFLSTDDPAKEHQIVERLKKNNISHQQVKAYLRLKARGQGGAPGWHSDLSIEHQQKLYPYALHAPRDLTQEKTYPLIVILHGMGGNGESTLKRWLPRLGEDFIIACPSYPMGAWWTFTAEEIIFKLIRQVKTRYPVNHNKVFLAGLSNGAIGTYMMGMFYPDRFAGIVPIAGAVTARYMHFLINLNNTPVYSIQGQHDPIFPVSISRRINKILTDLRYPLVYREHLEKGSVHGGHFMPESEVPALKAWLKSQERNPHARVIRMVREANHLGQIQWARVSKGYQLAALQIPGPEPETLNIKDGKIATMIAVHKEKNLFEILGKNLLENEIYLNADHVDLDRPVTVTFQELQETRDKYMAGEKTVRFEGLVKKDLFLLLHGFKDRWDPELLYDARIKISFGHQIARRP